MNKKQLLWIALGGVAVYGAWYMIKYMHVTPKEKNILDIVGMRYANFEDAFLKAWAEATKSGVPEFTYNGKTYLTENGRAKR
jgi:hypothetical protein